MRYVAITYLGLVAALGGGTVSLSALPIDFELYTDLRLTYAKGEPSWFDDYLGKARYGGNHYGDANLKLRLPEVSVLATADISWDTKAFVHVKYDPEQNKPIDLVEAYLTYTPVPKSAFSYAFKAGLYFPHISRENIGVAWTSPFTITPSAINSWVGEEIRALGLEAKGSYISNQHRFDITAGMFGFNDAAGTLLAFRGWGLGDAKVGAFSRLPLSSLPSIGSESSFLAQPLWVHPIREIDGRVGYYAALDYSFSDVFKTGAFYYDNRGDPEKIVELQYSWDTRFWNFYAESDFGDGLKLIAQYMTGMTEMGNLYGAKQRRRVYVGYDAGYVLATKKIDKYRLSARYDWFGVDDKSFVALDNNNENGTAFTAAIAVKVSKKTSLITEYLRIKSDRPSRLGIGFAEGQTNDIFQLSWRQRF